MFTRGWAAPTVGIVVVSWIAACGTDPTAGTERWTPTLVDGADAEDPDINPGEGAEVDAGSDATADSSREPISIDLDAAVPDDTGEDETVDSVCEASADGEVDCEDPSCSADPACTEDGPRETGRECHDFVDNDGDGLIDCDDPDCWGEPNCTEPGSPDTETDTECADGVDNDGDGLIDCDDPDCDSFILCGGEPPVSEDPDPDPDDPDPDDGDSGEESGWQCADFVDNDGNGLVDCDDPGCADFFLCDLLGGGTIPGTEETEDETGWRCSDRRDNDGNGLVDCDDPSCADWPGCRFGPGRGGS